MYLLVRRAWFWNAKNYTLSSQFGHIMLGVGENVYSFNQSAFVENPQYGCVQIISWESFCTTYQGQIWHVVELGLSPEQEQQVERYFRQVAIHHAYSLKNNTCTIECQRALEAAGIVFPKNYTFPGSVLAHIISSPAKAYISSHKKIIIESAIMPLHTA